MPIRGLKRDLAAIAVLAALALLFFWPVTMGGRTMLPVDSVYAWEPWRSAAGAEGVGVAHNSLVLDLYLQNYAWKSFIVDCLRAGELPLWNPYILSGVPFLAGGQHSAMYPLSAVFYVLPLEAAYGWFAALHVFLAGAFTYILARTLRVSRAGSLIAGAAFMFGGFMVIRNVFPMIVAAAVWLPLILAVVEATVRRAEEGTASPMGAIPLLAVGAAALGMVLLAGHPEMYYYVALATAAYSLWRLAGLWRRSRSWRRSALVAAGLVGMGVVGLGLGAAQWVPLLDLVRHNFREGSASFAEVLGWAYPPRRVISLLIPDFFGNPAHHNYLDLFTWQRVDVTVNALGERIDTIYWGIKNYVEGAAYVGILPLLLAAVAVLRRQGRRWGFFALLAALSLAFVFGSRLYWLVFRLPGLNQVHSPFRWVYLYTLSVAILAGMGADALWQPLAASARGWRRGLDLLASRWLPIAAFAGGLGVLGGLAGSLLAKERMAALAERALQSLAKAPEAFRDGRMFYSYEFRNLLIFGLFLLAAGGLLVLRSRFRRRGVWIALAAAVVFGELYVIGNGFFPRVRRELVAERPPVVDFLLADEDLFRLTTYVGGSEKTFNANAGMLYGLQDVRGYDSIIPRQYVEYMALISEQSELPYNRIAPLFEWQPDALDSRLLDLLNVRYVVASRERPIDRSGYELVYDGEVFVYRNTDALPRAFLVGRAEVIADPEARREALRTLEPLERVILDEAPSREYAGAEARGAVEAIDYTANEVLVTLSADAPALLVLGDAYMDGWVAYLRPAGAANPEQEEQALRIYRADGNFRAVEVPAGRYEVRFKYSPNPVKLGLFASFMAGAILVLALGGWAWQRYYRPAPEGEEGQRVAVNTLAPIALTLGNKGIDMVFAMLMLRILGPADAGEYYFAIVFIGWFDILTAFGLNTLITRALARDRAQANRYLSNATILRLGLWAAMVPVLALFFVGRAAIGNPIDPRTILAVALFGLGLLPSNVSAGLSAVFIGYERMEIPAIVSTLTTVLRVILGTLVLLLGLSYPGLGTVSIGVNLITVVVLYALVRRLLFRPRLEFDAGFQREMLRESYPLMVNNLLATLFFKVAVFLLEWMVPDNRVVGWYGTAYKYIDAVGVIPAYFTMAIFPLMARYAQDSQESLLRAYRLAVKILVMVALPLATLGWGLAEPLVAILGGSQYLPESADLLRIMIWYMPVGFINSVTQYVLIALNRQRYLTRAFGLGLAFSFLANLAFIALWGYQASAYIVVAAEFVLLVPFYLGVRRFLAPIPWVGLLWRIAASAVPLVALPALLPQPLRLGGLAVGLVIYGVGLWLLGAYDREERAILSRAIPADRVAIRLGLRRG